MFAVVGTEHDTSVTISIKLPPNEMVQFEGTTYSNGDIITLTINRYEAVQISSSGSFTGTLIRATADIAVFVGADYTSVRGRSMDHLVEQLQPLDSWGMDYMLIPFPDRSSFDLVMVTAQFEQTTVMYNNSQYVIDEAGENIILKLMSDTPSRLSSDKRVLVMQLSTSVSSDFDDIYDNDYGDYSDPKRDKVAFSSTEIPMSVQSTSISISSDSFGVTFTKSVSKDINDLWSVESEQ
ncbi:IgGFc-binding protein-like [Gigantopelta aegis]|uniref:IgGFc-binding protein-like n=1 Tax=Gigantopelta aegis TaxID=1735272 RepID=UPI001B889EF0|nr:IgGFc-binding protein-like [Gigantopelta aegis]